MNKVLNKIKLRKNMLFIIIVFVLIITVLFMFNKDNEYKESQNVKLKEQVKNKQFALMLEQTKGKGDYKESKSELPKEGYVFNESKSVCVDEKDEKS